MKKITAIPIWINGTIKDATILFAKVINDNLQDAATFQYTLFETTTDGYQGNQLTKNDLVMTGQDYVDYSTNEDAYNWVSKQINATIIGDYIEPIAEAEQPTQPISQP